jgi:C1A family cysteine protease
MLKYQFQIDFSEQQLIDCSSSYGNEGCNGGMMNNAYKYVINNGITLETYYPYRQTGSSCKYNSQTMPHFSIADSTVVYGDCSALLAILKKRPVAVLISANPSFIFYRSGVLNSCGYTINHAIQLVGVVNNSSGGYYIGKNSWGTAWGDQGYVYIDNKIEGGNLCDVCQYPQYPI